MSRSGAKSALRILYFSTGYGPHDHRFLSALARTEHKVSFLRLQAGPTLEDRPVPKEVEQISWKGDGAPFRWRDVSSRVQGLRAVIRRLRPDLIHAGPIQTCAFVAVLTGFRPVLTMSWGFDLMQDVDRNAWWNWITRFTLKRSAFFVSDAKVTRERAVAMGMPRDRTAVFPWGVDLKHFRPQEDGARRSLPRSGKSRRGGKAKPFVILCNRSWEPRYGVDVLARAFVEAARRNDEISLVLLGGGSQAQRIRAILAEGGVQQRAHLAGYVSQRNLPRWYRQADLFVSPSHIDGSSVSLMEALACGIPSLVSDIPANREWVYHGKNGWIFRDGDELDLANKILFIAAAHAQQTRISRAARRFAEAHADWSRNFQVLLRSYRKALQVT